jgi:hypothetical protein
MRGTSIRRFGGGLLAAATMAGAGAAATPAAAATWPTCTASVALAASGTSNTCNFRSPTGYSTITVAVDGTAVVTVRCVGFSVSRTFTTPGSWRTYTPSGCYLTVSSGYEGTTATATATPALGPFDDPPPPY